MPYAKPGDFTCATCHMPDLKIMGTVTVTGKSISGKLSLAKHDNVETGRPCRGTDSMVLLRHIVNARG